MGGGGSSSQIIRDRAAPTIPFNQKIFRGGGGRFKEGQPILASLAMVLNPT